MIVALVYNIDIHGMAVADWLVITSSEEEMTAKLEVIANKKSLPEPIPDKFEIEQRICLGTSIDAYAKIIYIGPLPEGGLII
jgi:hypothetical protein